MCASDIWSRAKIGRDLTHCCFQKLEHFLRVFIFVSVFFLPCCVIRWFLRLSNVTFIIVTRNDTVSCYLFQGHRNQWTGAEREAKNIAGLIFVETKNTRYKFNSERWFQLLSLFFSFFSSSTLRVEKEGRVQISSVTTKRRNFVLRVNTDEPAALTSAPLSHFTLFIRLSATLSRPRPFMRAHGHISNLPIYCSLLTFRCACISRILVHG